MFEKPQPKEEKKEPLPEELELGIREERAKIETEEGQNNKREGEDEKTREQEAKDEVEEEIEKIERIDTTAPENKYGILGNAIFMELIKTGGEKIANWISGEEQKQEKRLPFFDRVIETRADIEKLCDNEQKETFLKVCRNYEDEIKKAAPEKKKYLAKELETYKKDWKEAERREIQNRQIRDERRETMQRIFNR